MICFICENPICYYRSLSPCMCFYKKYILDIAKTSKLNKKVIRLRESSSKGLTSFSIKLKIIIKMCYNNPNYIYL